MDRTDDQHGTAAGKKITPPHASAESAKAPAAMEWEKIAEATPRGFEAWAQYLLGSTPADDTLYLQLCEEKSFAHHIGHLLAFFDERQLHVNAFYAIAAYQWVFTVYDRSSHYTKRSGVNFYNSRPQALAAAFAEAFSLLEERIKK